MFWLVPRVLLAALAAGLGTLAGSWFGGRSDVVLALAAAGGALGAAMSALFDRIQGYRLLKWLADDAPGEAPRGTAFWGELGYRIERGLRERDRQISSERSQREEFLAAIEASPNGVMLLDENAQIEWCSAVAADHFGLDPHRDILQRITNLVRDPAFVAHMQSDRHEQPVVFHSPRGTATLSVLVRRYGKDKQLLMSQDITERERADAMRRDFVANVSHEIRTPLTVLAGFVETLATLPLTEVERRRVLDLMEQQTGRMQSLVSDLLTLAQLEGSPRPPADAWVHVGNLLDRIHADGLALSAGRHTLQVSRDFVLPANALAATTAPPGGVDIAGSLTELQSAFSNLVTNAVRYTPEGGRVCIRWVLRNDGSGALEVQDSGPGIARDHIPRLTERFYRVDGSRSRETGGTGLGLSIVKHVMQRHGGEIEVDSELGKGSCFRLVFPASRLRLLPPAPPSTSQALADITGAR